MAKIKVHAGDFGAVPDGHYWAIPGTFVFPKGFWRFANDKISISEVETVEIANEESVKRIGGAVGWGAAGALILGPVGLLAGLLVGGRGKDTTFVCKLKDGRKFLATTDSKTYTKLLAAKF